MLVANAIELFLEMLSAERGVANLTLAAYKADLCAFVDYVSNQFGKKTCSDLGQDNVRHYLQFLSQKIAQCQDLLILIFIRIRMKEI